MGNLVTEDVIRFAKAGGKRHDDARLEALGEAAGALTRCPGTYIGSREIRVTGIENDYLPVGERVIKQC